MCARSKAAGLKLPVNGTARRSEARINVAIAFLDLYGPLGLSACKNILYLGFRARLHRVVTGVRPMKPRSVWLDP